MGESHIEYIQTSDGTAKAIEGVDYVVRTEYGEIYPLKKTIFNQTYEVLPERSRKRKRS